MRLIKCLIIAFSIYSRIPMPHFKWEEDDFKYNLCFLPFVGAVIGALIRAVFVLVEKIELPLLTTICLISAVPLVITGGFHVDGFMDVKDALSSYKSKEEKLAILKDPHIGAFAVINLGLYGLLWIGALSVICDRNIKSINIAFAFVFVLSRIVTAISSVTLKKAKKDGMLSGETKHAGRIELIVMIAELLCVLGALAFVDIYVTALLFSVCAIVFVFYRHKTYREFGGVTGDTAGYQVCVSELLMLMALAIFSLL